MTGVQTCALRSPELQVIACEVGLTVLVGIVVLIPMLITWIVKHPVAGSIAVTVKLGIGAEIETEVPVAVNEGLVHE